MMLEQFGTITVRECRLTRSEVENMIGETLRLRGPSGYEFDYLNPIFLWDDKGNLVVRWPSRAMREEARRASELRLVPWSDFIKKQAEALNVVKKT